MIPLEILEMLFVPVKPTKLLVTKTRLGFGYYAICITNLDDGTRMRVSTDPATRRLHDKGKTPYKYIDDAPHVKYLLEALENGIGAKLERSWEVHQRKKIVRDIEFYRYRIDDPVTLLNFILPKLRSIRNAREIINFFGDWISTRAGDWIISILPTIVEATEGYYGKILRIKLAKGRRVSVTLRSEWPFRYTVLTLPYDIAAPIVDALKEKNIEKALTLTKLAIKATGARVWNPPWA